MSALVHPVSNGSSPTVHVALQLSPRWAAWVKRRLEQAGYRGVWMDTAAQLEQCLPDVRFLVVGRPPRIDWTPAKYLQLIHVAGAGVDPLFPAVGLAASVRITNSRGAHADAVRDHVLALLLSFARDLPRAARQQAERRWQGFSAAPLRGQRLCIVGLGEIGRRVATTAQSLGLDVVGVCRTPRSVSSVSRCYGPDELQRAVAGARYIVLCVPLTSRTRGWFDAELLEALPADSVLINVSRGGIVDEPTLERQLRAGALRGAALDVFAEEPLPASSTLWTCPGLLVTPHCAGYTPDYLVPVLDDLLTNLSHLGNAAALRGEVSRETEY